MPFKRAEDVATDSGEEIGPPCNADYFGKLDSSRLIVDEDESLIYLLGDANLRSKPGVTHRRACPVIGSRDSGRGVLTIVDFTLPEFAPDGYTNNPWEIQDDPYAGDVINAYNDGPNDSGDKLGGFYELESLGPALALEPLDSYTHVHRTIRLEGNRDALSAAAVKVFGVNLDRIESRFKT